MSNEAKMAAALKLIAESEEVNSGTFVCDFSTLQGVAMAALRGSTTPPAAQVQGEREEFEAYAKSRGWDRHHLKRAADDPERYDDWGVQPEWLAFKAGSAWRAALSAPPAAGVPEGWRELAQQASDALQVFTGHDSGPNLRHRYGEKWWEPLDQLRGKLRAMLKAAPTPPASEQQQAVVMSAAAADVLAERRRQVEKEGWSTEHDEEHDAGVLAAGAAAYALNAVDQLHPLSQGANAHKQPACWPWAHAYWKPGVPRRDLVKAGALILAEIERWDRTISHLAGVNQGVTTEAGNGGEV